MKKKHVVRDLRDMSPDSIWQGKEVSPDYWALISPAGDVYHLKVKEDQEVVKFIEIKSNGKIWHK